MAAVGRAPMAAFVEVWRSRNWQQVGGFLNCGYTWPIRHPYCCARKPTRSICAISSRISPSIILSMVPEFAFLSSSIWIRYLPRVATLGLKGHSSYGDSLLPVPKVMWSKNERRLMVCSPSSQVLPPSKTWSPRTGLFPDSVANQRAHPPETGSSQYQIKPNPFQ